MTDTPEYAAGPTRALLVPFDAVLAADDAPAATGVYIDAAGRFGIAAGSARLAVQLDAAAARAIAAGLVTVADAMDRRDAATAAEAGARLAEIATAGRA